MLTLAGAFTAANAQTALTQDGYALTAEYTVPATISNSNISRAAIGFKDKFYVNTYASDKVVVYDKTGAQISEIVTPATGDVQYHNWLSMNVDAAGHLLVQMDLNAWAGIGGAGNVTPNGAHGIMIVDTDNDQVLQSFVPFGGGAAMRFDAMAPVMKDITKDYNTRIINVLCGNTNNAYQQSFNENKDGVNEASFWKVAAFNMEDGINLMNNIRATSTGYALEYMPVGATASNLAMYCNPSYTVTFSDEGKFGNAIKNYTGNWTWDNTFFYTPMHSGLTAFNIFTIGEKQYIVYPAKNVNAAAGADNRPADAFAIAEVSFVDSPVTDMTMEGETLVDGKPVGKLLAIFSGSGVDGATSCVPSYTIEKVEGDENSVYIYVFGIGAPACKWKFTVNAETEQPVEPAPDPEPAESLLTQEGVTLTSVYTIDEAITAGSRSGVGMNDHIYVTVPSDASATSTGAIKVYDANGTLVNTIESAEGYQIWPNTNVDAAGHVLVQIDKAAFLPNATPTAWDGADINNFGHGLMVMESEFSQVLVDKLPMGGGWPTRYDAMAPIAQNIMTDYNTRVMAVLSGGVNSYQNSYNQVAGDVATYWKVAGFDTSSNLGVFQAIDGGAVAATAQTSTGLAGEYHNADGGLELAVFSNYTYKSTYSDTNFYGNAISQYTGAGNYKPTGKYFFTPMHANMPGFTVFSLAGKQYIIYPANSIANRASRLGDAFVITEVTFVDSPLTDIEAAGEKFVGEGTINPESPVMAYYAGAAKGNASNSNVISYAIEPIFGQDNSAFIYVYCAGAPVNKWRFTVGEEQPLPEESIVITSAPEVTVNNEDGTVTIAVSYAVSEALVGHLVDVTVNGEHYAYFRADEATGTYDVVLPVEEGATEKAIKLICRNASASYDVSTSVISLDVDSVNAPAEYYNLQGIRVDNPENGIFIVKQGKNVTKVVR